MRRAWLLAVSITLSALGACVIGPKQDDPAGAELGPGDDGGFTADTSDNLGDDAGPSSTPDGGAGGFADAAAADATGDALTDAGADARTDGDAMGDACAEGSVALTATGPFDVPNDCWIPKSQVFECVGGIDGGAALTCFVRVATGETFLAPTTHIPSGSDYRACTTTEMALTSKPMCSK